MSSIYFKIIEHEVPCQHIRGYYRSTAISQEDVLLLSTKQYIPLNNLHPSAGDVTIIACHAAGMLKELYEPFFDSIYMYSQQDRCSFRIRSIWMADIATHGKSSVLNEGRLGIDYTWDDHARDLLHMVNTFRVQMPQPIVGFGHSMGGANIVQLASMHPRLFTSVVLLEPAMNKEYAKTLNFTPTYGVTKKRDVWPSREAAIRETTMAGVQRTWDPSVQERWAKYALRDLPTLNYPETPRVIADRSARNDRAIPVTLTTTKHHDVRAYARGVHPSPDQLLHTFVPNRRTHPDITKTEFDALQQPAYQPGIISIYRQLPFLRPACLCLYGDKSVLTSASPEARNEMCSIIGTEAGGSGGVKAGKVRSDVVAGGGHFVIFEKPAAVAEATSAWLLQSLEWFHQEQEANRKEWEHVGTREKALLDDAWMVWVKEAYGRRKPAEIRGESSKL